MNSNAETTRSLLQRSINPSCLALVFADEIGRRQCRPRPSPSRDPRAAATVARVFPVAPPPARVVRIRMRTAWASAAAAAGRRKIRAAVLVLLVLLMVLDGLGRTRVIDVCAPGFPPISLDEPDEPSPWLQTWFPKIRSNSHRSNSHHHHHYDNSGKAQTVISTASPCSYSLPTFARPSTARGTSDLVAAVQIAMDEDVDCFASYADSGVPAFREECAVWRVRAIQRWRDSDPQCVDGSARRLLHLLPLPPEPIPRS